MATRCRHELVVCDSERRGGDSERRGGDAVSSRSLRVRPRQDPGCGLLLLCFCFAAALLLLCCCFAAALLLLCCCCCGASPVVVRPFVRRWSVDRVVGMLNPCTVSHNNQQRANAVIHSQSLTITHSHSQSLTHSHCEWPLLGLALPTTTTTTNDDEQ